MRKNINSNRYGKNYKHGFDATIKIEHILIIITAVGSLFWWMLQIDKRMLLLEHTMAILEKGILNEHVHQNQINFKQLDLARHLAIKNHSLHQLIDVRLDRIKVKKQSRLSESTINDHS